MSRFQTTRWSLILSARDAPERARPALEQLCRIYRPPVLAYIRRCGHADAEDLAQAFFLRFLERGWHASAAPERGRFRALLLTSLRHFLDDQRAQAMALKRGGTAAHDDAPEDLADTGETPEQAFTRAWLGTVLVRAMTRLQGEWERDGKRAQFEQLAPLLVEHAAGNELHALAQASGVRANTLSVQAHRMRQRLRQLVRLELLHTVGAADAVDDELAELRGALEEAG